MRPWRIISARRASFCSRSRECGNPSTLARIPRLALFSVDKNTLPPKRGDPLPRFLSEPDYQRLESQMLEVTQAGERDDRLDRVWFYLLSEAGLRGVVIIRVKMYRVCSPKLYQVFSPKMYRQCSPQLCQ